MGLHNELTSYPKLLAAFRRSLGETSTDFTGIERAGETITPILDLWALPEWALLRGEVIFSRTAGVSGGGRDLRIDRAGQSHRLGRAGRRARDREHLRALGRGRR